MARTSTSLTTQKISRGITRFEYEQKSGSGFMVRLCRNGQRINEFFSDARCGGKAKAKKAAKERYEQLVEEHGPASNSMKGMVTSRNTTGIVGVHIAHGVDNRFPNCEYWAYCASWVSEDGSRSKISFSWNKYGEEEALELAKFARAREICEREKVETLFAKSQAAKKKRRLQKLMRKAK